MSIPSYHDVYFQFDDGPKTRLFDAPFSVMISCTRVGGWELNEWTGEHYTVRAGEYNELHPLRLWVADTQICGEPLLS